jgi:hypothetical protein
LFCFAALIGHHVLIYLLGANRNGAAVRGRNLWCRSAHAAIVGGRPIVRRANGVNPQR